MTAEQNELLKLEAEIRVVLVLKHHTIKIYRRVEVKCHTFLISA
jgi:hypothetical protein